MRGEHNYWNRALGRRRALRYGASAGAGLAGLALIGCGEDEPAPAATAPTATASSPSTSSQEATPKTGGTLRLAVQQDVDTFDPIAATGGKTLGSFGGYVYLRLFKFIPGDGIPATGAMEGDLIESWEQPDELTHVLHLRQGVTWDQRPPTSGRDVTAEDVKASWDYFKVASFYLKDLVHDQNAQAAVLDMTAVDNATVQMDLAHPDAAVLAMSASWTALWQMPAEAFSGGFDPATDWRGAGPFLLTSHRSSGGFTYERNPDYYDAPRPYVDKLELAIIPDEAQLEAQFAAKKLHYGLSADAVVDMHQRLSGTRIDVLEPSVSGNNIGVSLRPESPFHDVRVRQALNMLIDRSTIIEVLSEPARLEQFGIKLGRYWNTPINAGYGAFWLDPNSEGFGPAAKYLQLNPEEAKKLLDAAGFAFDREVPLTFTSNNYGREWPRIAEMLQSMLQVGGIKTVLNGIDYATGWIPNYLRAKGDFEGLAMWVNGARPDVGHWLQVFCSSVGANNQMGTSYPELDEMIFSQQKITDFDERVSAVHDVQRYMVENAIGIPFIGTVGTELVDLSWEGVHGRQLRAWPGGEANAERVPRYWLEESLRT